MLSAVLGALWGCIQYVMYAQRISGPQIDVNAFAAVVYMGSFLWLSHRWLTRQAWCGWTITGQFLLLCAMMATFSRGGVATWGLGCAALFFIGYRFRYSLRPLLIYLLVALFAYTTVKFLPVFFGSDILSRNFQDISSLNARLPQWEAAWSLFTSSPWLGTGLGTFSVLYPPLRSEYVSAGKLVHNDYLQLLQEGGILLAVLFTLWLIWHLRYLWVALFQMPKNKHTALRMELACLITLNLLLFTHALINFIFYIDYLNMVSGVIFARILWLVWRLGYLPLTSKINLSFVTKLGAVAVLCVLWTKLALTGVPHLLFMEWKQDKTDNSLTMHPEITRWLLTLDPLNSVASASLIQMAYSSMPSLESTSQQKVFDMAWSQASLLAQRQSVDPKVHYWLGILKRRATELGLDFPENTLPASDYQRQALKQDPGYLPAHIEIAKELEQQKSAREALDYLAPVFWQWYKMVSVRETYQLLGVMIRLADAVQAPEADKYRAMKEHMHHWINNAVPLKPRYEG